MMRATTSVVPPAAKGTTMVMLRSGYAAAAAPSAAQSASAAPPRALETLLICSSPAPFVLAGRPAPTLDDETACPQSAVWLGTATFYKIERAGAPRPGRSEPQRAGR